MEQAIFEATKIQVGLLEKTNWATWRYKIMAAMRGLGLLDIIEGRISKPVLVDPKQIEKFNVELQSYQRANNAALLLITTNLSDENLQKVMRYTVAREVWLELHRLHAGESQDRAYDLCMKFFSYKKQPEHDMSTHMSQMKNIWFELTQEMNKSEVKGELPEIFLICKILDTLPEDYFSFKSIWLLILKSETTVENLTSQLCTYERALTCKNEVDAEVLNIQGTKAKPKKIIRSVDKRNKEKCHYCGMIGHRIK